MWKDIKYPSTGCVVRLLANFNMFGSEMSWIDMKGTHGHEDKDHRIVVTNAGFGMAMQITKK
ncbi:hypothetical protein HanIR_Chr06g0259481 [Helianthus annuus]|nr:hypothetical protein HanIR_Chr06g0259481 [Helianthus annuus]